MRDFYELDNSILSWADSIVSSRQNRSGCLFSKHSHIVLTDNLTLVLITALKHHEIVLCNPYCRNAKTSSASWQESSLCLARISWACATTGRVVWSLCCPYCLWATRSGGVIWLPEARSWLLDRGRKERENILKFESWNRTSVMHALTGIESVSGYNAELCAISAPQGVGSFNNVLLLKGLIIRLLCRNWMIYWRRRTVRRKEGRCEDRRRIVTIWKAIRNVASDAYQWKYR